MNWAGSTKLASAGSIVGIGVGVTSRSVPPRCSAPPAAAPAQTRPGPAASAAGRPPTCDRGRHAVRRSGRCATPRPRTCSRPRPSRRRSPGPTASCPRRASPSTEPVRASIRETVESRLFATQTAPPASASAAGPLPARTVAISAPGARVELLDQARVVVGHPERRAPRDQSRRRSGRGSRSGARCPSSGRSRRASAGWCRRPRASRRAKAIAATLSAPRRTVWVTGPVRRVDPLDRAAERARDPDRAVAGREAARLTRQPGSGPRPRPTQARCGPRLGPPSRSPRWIRRRPRAPPAPRSGRSAPPPCRSAGRTPTSRWVASEPRAGSEDWFTASRTRRGDRRGGGRRAPRRPRGAPPRATTRPAGARVAGREGRVMRKDSLLELAQLRPRLEPQLGGEADAGRRGRPRARRPAVRPGRGPA